MIKFRFSKKFKIVKFDGRFCPFLMVKFKLRYNTCLFLSDSGSIRRISNFNIIKGSTKFGQNVSLCSAKLIYTRGSGGVGVPSLPISDRVVDDGRSLL